MSKTRTTMLAVLAAVALSAVAMHVDRAAAVSTGGDIEQKIANAKTAADHEAIAEYYEKEAAEAREQAQMHREMGAAYKKLGGAAVGKWHLPAHCDGLTKVAESAARDYSELARAHHAMAKAAK